MTTQGLSAGFNPALLEKEKVDDLLGKLPEVTGLRRLPVHYTSFDVKEPWTALGSDIGLVCVYNSQKNRLFQLHEVRQTITVVKLSLDLNCLAYGSQDGVLRMISFNQMATEPSDALVREAQQCSVTALEWNKHRLFSGFSSGKVLTTTVKLNKGSCTTGLLLQTGSHVVQLTSHGHHLLVCTLASSFTLQYITGKLSQIGHQDRKAGPYGACFSAEADNIFVARPGLRLWKAQASTGTVISTSKYREALVSRSIPIIPLLGVNPSHPVITDRTQFTLLHTWCGKFVITHHQHALWVLDPSCSSVVATLAERLPIIDVTCCKDSVYLLRPDKSPIVKLSIHADFKRLLGPVKGISDSSSELSSSLDSGSYQSSVEGSINKSSSKVSTESAPVLNNTTSISSKMAMLSQQNVSKGISQSVSQGMSQSVPRSMSQSVSQDVSDSNTLQDMSRSMSQSKSQGVSQSTSQGVPQSTSQGVSQSTSQGVSQIMSQDVLRTKSVSVSRSTPQVDGHKATSRNRVTLAEMPIEDRVHKMQISSPDVESSNIAVQSVLKKKKKKKKKTSSHDVLDSPILSQRDHLSDRSSSPVHDTVTSHHVQAGVDAGLGSHAHPDVDNVVVIDGSHAQFKVDDVQQPNIDQEVVMVTESDTTLMHTDQTMVAISNSDAVLTQTGQETVATSNSNNGNVIQNDDISDGAVFSTPANQEETPREAVGYHIERLQEDKEPLLNNVLQLSPETELANQDNKIAKDKSPVTKDDNVVDNNLSNKEEAGATPCEDSKVATVEKTENLEQEDVIHPFLPVRPKPSKQEAISNADFTTLIKKYTDDMATRLEHRRELFGAVSPQPKEGIDQLKEPVKEDKVVAASTTDIWITIPPCPSKVIVKRVTAASRILWAMDSKGATYWYSLDNNQWHTEKQSMEYISSSPSGAVVWGLYKGQCYARKGINEKTPQGQSWHKVIHEVLVKLIAVGESCVWTVNQDDKLMCRQGTSSVSPGGFQWQQTQLKANFAKSITFCDDVLWACDKMGTAYALNTADSLSHAQWETADGCLVENLSLTKGGIIWGVEQQLGTVYFRCDVAPVSPCGIGPWWKVSTAQPVSQETTFAGVIANKVTSVVPDAITNRLDSFSNRVTNSLPMNFIKNTIGSLMDNSDAIRKIAASSQVVWVLDGKGVIRYCRSVVIGSHYTAVSSLELMMVSQWTQISAMSTVSLNQGGLVWALRSTNELFCFNKEGTVAQIEYPSSVIKQVATSTTAVWIATNKGIYARDNITKHNPQGTSWTKVDMALQNNETVSWLSCGKHVVWLVDSAGSVLMRFSVHSTAEASLAQAWIEVESPSSMTQIMVGTEDWLVWTCDTHYNVYVRNGITDTFPIGSKWELVPGCKAINLCSSGNYVWALCPGGEILCRYGVKKDNVMGDYWKCITGHFCHISATLCGQLWGITENKRLLKRTTCSINVSDYKPKTAPEMKNPEEWDIL